MRVILCGQGSSGKDHLKKKLVDKGFTPSISYTTREPRPGEVEGVDYHFISEATFLKMVDNNEFREWNKFANKWYYGTTNKHFDAADVFIMTPSGIKALTEEERKKFLIIFLDIPEYIRRDRLLARKGPDDPERRLTTDRIDFAGFSSYDIRITNHDF